MAYDNQLFTNNAVALLAAPIGPGSTSLTVMTGLGALYPQPVGPTDYFLVTLEDQTGLLREIVRVNGRTGDTFTGLIRGQEGTTAQAWAASLGNDTLVDHRVTAETMRLAMALPESISGSSSLAPISVPSTTTQNVNIAGYSQYQRGFKFFVTIFVPATFQSCTFEVLGNIKGNIATNSETATWNRTARVGDNLAGSVTITLNTALKELQLTWNNGEVNPVEVMCTRIQHLP